MKFAYSSVIRDNELSLRDDDCVVLEVIGSNLIGGVY